MSWLAVSAATIGGLIVAALAAPVHLDLRVDVAERVDGNARVRWLFGLLNISLGSARRNRPASTRRHTARPVRGRATTPAPRRNMLAFVSTPHLLHQVLRLLEGLFHAVRVDHLRVRARFGFDDPADTGQACGVLLPVSAVAASRGADVDVVPDFERAVLAGTCAGVISVTPLRVIGVILRFLCSPPVWRAIRVSRGQS